jgi:hypothetical protein
MAFVLIKIREFLQFECFTEDPNAQPLLAECAGGAPPGFAFFSAFSVEDVILPNSNDQFFFNPDLIFPQVEPSPGAAAVGEPLGGHQRFAAILLVPSKGLTFANSGQGPMLIFRRVDAPKAVLPGSPTVLNYAASQGDTVVFEFDNPSPIPTTNLADPSNFG